MPFRCLHDRKEIEPVLRRNSNLYLYSLGDLDDSFWPLTAWYGWMSGEKLTEVACLYASPGLPTLLALTDRSGSADGMERLLAEILYLLPSDFSAHISPGLEKVFTESYSAVYAEPHYRMVLPGTANLPDPGKGIAATETVRLGNDDIKEMLELYDESYPGNWFNPSILDTNIYFGIRAGGKLVSLAGTHIYSPALGIAAVGNVSTRPAFRGMGLGTAVTAALCRKLASEKLHIGLNVKTGNIPAIKSYQKLGFIKTDTFGEILFSRRTDN